MAKGRELKGRIKTVENTRKITRTMEMVATSKMKRAQDRVVAARPFAAALGEIGRIEAGDDVGETQCVWPCCLHTILRALHFRSGDHLERARDLAGVLDRFDSPF